MIIYTKHGLEKMDALGIEDEEVESTVRLGMKGRDADGEKWHAQRGGLEVVFARQEDMIVIITVYLARRKK